jgi:hypothetical protein
MVFRTSPKVAVTDDTFGHWLMYFFKFFSIDRPYRLAVGGANHGSWARKIAGTGVNTFRHSPCRIRSGCECNPIGNPRKKTNRSGGGVTSRPLSSGLGKSSAIRPENHYQCRLPASPGSATVLLSVQKASLGSGFVFGVVSDGRSGMFVWGRA